MPLTTGIASFPPLYAYAFKRASGSDATLTGYFVDDAGVQLTALQTFTIGATATNFITLYGAALPDGAVGFLGALATSAIYVGLGSLAAGTVPSASPFDARPGSGYPQVPVASNVGFGRVPR
jgi:hypothetical protein